VRALGETHSIPLEVYFGKGKNFTLMQDFEKRTIYRYVFATETASRGIFILAS